MYYNRSRLLIKTIHPKVCLHACAVVFNVVIVIWPVYKCKHEVNMFSIIFLTVCGHACNDACMGYSHVQVALCAFVILH